MKDLNETVDPYNLFDLSLSYYNIIHGKNQTQTLPKKAELLEISQDSMLDFHYCRFLLIERVR